jgi:hypothetical protein
MIFVNMIAWRSLPPKEQFTTRLQPEVLSWRTSLGIGRGLPKKS